MTQPADPECPREVCLLDDGRYFAHGGDSELDLISEVQELGSFAA